MAEADSTLSNGDSQNNLILYSLTSLKNDFYRLTEDDPKRQLSALSVINQLEMQLKFGEVNSEEDIQQMIIGLKTIVHDLNISETESLTLAENINYLSDAYFELPKEKPAEIPHIVIIGETGTGKSTLGNVFLGEKKFATSAAMKSCTAEIRSFSGSWLNRGRKKILVMDTPGLNDADMEDKDNLANLENQLKALKYVSSFVLVFNSAQPRITRTHHFMIQILQAMFGLDFFLNMCIVFTNWSANPEVNERRKARGITAEGKYEEINRLLRERFNLQRNIPCYFVDSMEWQVGFNRQAHEEFLDDFFTEAVNKPPFNLLNLQAMEHKTKEAEKILERQKNLLQAVPRQKLPASEAEKIGTALDVIEAPQRHNPPADNGMPLVRYNEELAIQQRYRERLGRWQTVFDVLMMMPVFGNMITNAAKVVVSMVRNGGMILDKIVSGAKAVGNFSKRIF